MGYLPRDLLLSGRLFDAAEAHRYGLVNEVVAPDQLLPRAEALAQSLIENSPSSVRLTKQLINGFIRQALDAQIAQAIERKRSEEALRESQRRMDRAQEIAHLGHWTVNLQTGAQTWRFPEKPSAANPFFATPALTPDGSQLIVGGYDKKLYSLDTKTGKATWTFAQARDKRIGGPLVTDKMIFAPNSDYRLYALNLQGTLQWEFEADQSIWGTPVSDGTNVYFGDLGRKVYAINIATGNQVWVQKVDGAVLGVPVLSKDILYVGTYGGTVYGLNTASGQNVWSKQASSWIWNGPSLNGTDLFVGDANGKLFSFPVSGNGQPWTQALSGAIIGTPQAPWAWGKKFRAYDKLSGKLLWEATLPFSGNATPATYEIGGRQFVVIAAVEEERDSDGARFIASKYRPDFAIIGEPNHWDRLALGYKGSAWADLTITKEQFHSAHAGETACEAIVETWLRIRAFAEQFNSGRQKMFEQLSLTLRVMDSGADGFSQWARISVGARLPVDLPPQEWYAVLKQIADEAAGE